MKSKKILIISIIIILVLAVAGAALAYLAIGTDTFKSDKELFAKYISQNMEMTAEFSDLKATKIYDQLKEKEKYELNTKIKAIYSEGGEVSSPINDISATISAQRDNTDGYLYADGQILLGQQKYLESELIKDKGAYGVRFTDVVKQFITIKDDQNLEAVASDLGTDVETLRKIMDAIDEKEEISEEIISKEELQTLKEKYSNLISNALSNGTFESNKKAMITYNNATVTTNSYSVKLTSNQVEELLVQILNNLKTEEKILDIIKTEKEDYQNNIDKIIEQLTDEQEIPEVKITVYEQNKITIRTVIEIGTNKIVVENTKNNNELKSNIQISLMNSEETNEYNIELSKTNNETQENLDFTINVTQGEENYTINFNNKMAEVNSSIQIDSSINYKKDILTASIILENDIDINGNFEKKQELSDNNNFILNNAESEVRKNVIEQLKQRVPEKFNTRISELTRALGLSKDANEEENSEMTQIDINKFNAKFEFYTGDEVSAENVKALLEIVKNNLKNYEIKTINSTENTELVDQSKNQYSIKLVIAQNQTNEEGVKQVLDKIDDKKKYKISISYNNETKLIDYITIEETTK